MKHAGWPLSVSDGNQFGQRLEPRDNEASEFTSPAGPSFVAEEHVCSISRVDECWNKFQLHCHRVEVSAGSQHQKCLLLYVKPDRHFQAFGGLSRTAEAHDTAHSDRAAGTSVIDLSILHRVVGMRTLALVFSQPAISMIALRASNFPFSSYYRQF